MKASEALAIAQQNLAGPAIEPLLKQIYASIAAAAHKGQFTIQDLFFCTHPMPSNAQVVAIRAHLRAEGYELEDHPDPDPGHPCSRPYTTLSWKP